MHHTTGGSDTREPRVLDGPELAFNLAAEAEALRAEPGYTDFGRSSKTLVRSGPLRVVLTAARAGVELGAETAEGAVAVSIIDGALAGGRGSALEAGALAWFGAGRRWSARVERDALLLLAVAGDDRPEDGA